MDIHKQFVEYGRNAKEWMRKCAILLPEIERQGIWRKRGFGSVHEYAAKLAGMSRGQVDESLRVMNKIRNKPALLKVVRTKGINAVRPVATIATQETEEFWAEKAVKMSQRSLEAYVREYRGRPPSFRTEFENFSTREDLVDICKKYLELTKPRPAKTAHRHIPTDIKRWVLEKYNHKCAFPGCTKPFKILHHTERFALTKTHNPDTIVPLCSAHEQFAHHGLIHDEKGDPQEWSIRQRPDENSPEYYVDYMVQLHRMSATRN